MVGLKYEVTRCGWKSLTPHQAEAVDSKRGPHFLVTFAPLTKCTLADLQSTQLDAE